MVDKRTSAIVIRYYARVLADAWHATWGVVAGVSRAAMVSLAVTTTATGIFYLLVVGPTATKEWALGIGFVILGNVAAYLAFFAARAVVMPAEIDSIQRQAITKLEAVEAWPLSLDYIPNDPMCHAPWERIEGDTLDAATFRLRLVNHKESRIEGVRIYISEANPPDDYWNRLVSVPLLPYNEDDATFCAEAGTTYIDAAYCLVFRRKGGSCLRAEIPRRNSHHRDVVDRLDLKLQVSIPSAARTAWLSFILKGDAAVCALTSWDDDASSLSGQA